MPGVFTGELGHYLVFLIMDKVVMDASLALRWVLRDEKERGS
jgi:hypothetical protein